MLQCCNTIPKLGLYTFDVGSDWLNGASLMNYTLDISGDYDSLLNHTINVGNGTINTRTILDNTVSEAHNILNAGMDWLAWLTLQIKGNSTSNHTCLTGTESNRIHYHWGVLTIAMTWFPAAAGIALLIATKETDKCKWNHLLQVTIRFLLWPLLLPIAM